MNRSKCQRVETKQFSQGIFVGGEGVFFLLGVCFVVVTVVVAFYQFCFSLELQISKLRSSINWQKMKMKTSYVYIFKEVCLVR